MPLALADIRSLVETGEFQQLIGEFEGEHLDAEAQRYLFRQWQALVHVMQCRRCYPIENAIRNRPLAWQYRNLNWSRSIARFA